MLSTLRSDFKAVFERDPSARETLGWLEVILSYSGWHAVLAYRFNHFFSTKCKLPVIPRLFSQLVKFITGVEIHPSAKIGKGFFIDHGMGVVIGETTVIKDNVTIFQGVTLGGTGKRKGKRHPTIGNNVTIGAGAIVLGSVNIGDHVKVGAGSVVVHDVPENCTVVGVPGTVVRRKGKEVPAIDMDSADLPDPIIDKFAKIQKEIHAIEKYMEESKKGFKKS